MDVRRLVLVLAAPVLILTAPDAGQGAEVRAERARPVEVTVYADRAEVRRQASVTVPAGPVEVVFEALPPGIERDSLRVSARGVPAAIGAVELREHAQEPVRSPEYAAAEAEVRRLESELAGLEAEEAADREMGEFLRALRATTGRHAAERLAEGRPDPEAVRGLFEFVRSQLEDLGRRGVSRQERRRAGQERLQVARARREAARPRGPIRVRTVRVAVEARQAGELELDLRYVVPGAGWRPAYRAVLDADRSEVSLTSEAVVVQRTGEDWEGVELRLSTAAPARGVRPPRLDTVVLRTLEAVPPAVGTTAPASGLAGAAVARSAPAEGRADRSVPMAPPPALVETERAEASVVQTAWAVTFVVPGRSTIAADGRDHRVALRSETLAATLGYRVVPALREEAYVVAKARGPAEVPLLAGPMRVFTGPGYLGEVRLEEAGPGAQLELPFGPDNRVRVRRVVLPQRRTREGLTGRDQQVAYGFRTEIENLRDRAVTVVVEEQAPVSEDERITVKRGDGTTPGAREVRDRPGGLQWEVALEPGQKREVVLEYAVRFPRDLAVGGLP
jgi:uncharacterized protein (TIGR02231 family)